MAKTPTLQEKVIKYEELLHLIQLNYEVVMNDKNTRKLLDNISRWSYSHRQGNGELSDKEQRDLVNNAFNRLTDL